jgi:threonine/homoserine/homoserine lactone efflux protein
MLNLFNPMIFTLWLTVSAYLINRKIIADSHLAMSVFAFGVALGTFLLHYSVAEFTARRHTGISPAMRYKINQGIGWLFIGFGVYAGWKLLEDIGAIAKMQAVFGS